MSFDFIDKCNYKTKIKLNVKTYSSRKRSRHNPRFYTPPPFIFKKGRFYSGYSRVFPNNIDRHIFTSDRVYKLYWSSESFPIILSLNNVDTETEPPKINSHQHNLPSQSEIPKKKSKFQLRNEKISRKIKKFFKSLKPKKKCDKNDKCHIQ